MWSTRKKADTRTGSSEEISASGDEVKFNWEDWFVDAGKMGFAPSEFENVTPYQFSLMRKGYKEDQKYRWQRARFQAYWTYTMAGKIAKNDITIEQFMPLDEDDLTDPEEEAMQHRKKTPEEIKKLTEFFNSF